MNLFKRSSLDSCTIQLIPLIGTPVVRPKLNRQCFMEKSQHPQSRHHWNYTQVVGYISILKINNKRLHVINRIWAFICAYVCNTIILINWTNTDMCSCITFVLCTSFGCWLFPMTRCAFSLIMGGPPYCESLKLNWQHVIIIDEALAITGPSS